MKFIKIVLILIGIAALAVTAYCGYGVFSGRMEVSADGEHGRLTGWVLQTTREKAVAAQAQDIDVQLPDLDDEDLLLETVVGYEDMCAACHAPPGGTSTSLAQGLNPPAPDLAESAVKRSPGELFWVTKHGIRMTGMPAWGVTHDDADLWPVIALITRFPDFADGDYDDLLEAAQEAGVEHDHDHEHEDDPHHEDDEHHHYHEHDDHDHSAHHPEDNDEHEHDHQV